MTREELLQREYFGRIERAVDHIYAHYSEDIGLVDLADVAGFSRFHFHRIFSSAVGETVAEFIKRIRLQQAASRLFDHPEESITDVALAVGFSSASVFARSFKERFGVTASEWRRFGRKTALRQRERKDRQDLGILGQEDRTPRHEDGTLGQDPEGPNRYASFILSRERKRRQIRVTQLSYTVEVQDLPERTVAYARHIGPYPDITEAFDRLAQWAGPRGLYEKPGALNLSVFHDTPEITDEAKLRSSACLTVPPNTVVSGDINLMTIPGGKYAVAHFEILPHQFGEAWDALMDEWFPSSGYQPDDRMCYEIYRQTPQNHPEGKFVVDLCEPVRPLL